MLGIIIIIITIIIITITIIIETTNQIPLFIETSCHHSSNPHAYIDVINIDIKYEADARIYFTEAINHCDEEWATHKRYIPALPISSSFIIITNPNELKATIYNRREATEEHCTETLSLHFNRVVSLRQ